MTRILTLLGGLGLAFAAAAPAAAQAIDPDVKCFIVSNIFSQNDKDPKGRQLAMVSGIFYAGRMDGRLSGAQLKTQIIAVQRGVKPAELGTIMTACAKRLQERQAALQDIGKSIVPPAGAKPAAPAAPTGPVPPPASR